MSTALAIPQQQYHDDLSVARSDEFQAILGHLNDLAQSYNFPESRQQENYNYIQRFYSLVKTWRGDLKHISSITDAALHPSYQQIIGMGEKILPFLLRELESKPLYWFWAVKAITHVDPVPPGDKGKVKKMRDAWLKWARSQGYEW